MKMKTRKRIQMKLRDVIRIVSELTGNDHEVSMVIADLMNRGYIKARAGGRSQKFMVF
jgi:hypothetical protein